jgi:DNA-binding transcriptional regulator YhcF (GntR family)
LLPGRIELAARLDVSSNTVSIAIARLKCDGVLAGVQGQRPRVARPAGVSGPAIDKAQSRARPRRSWDAVAEHLKDDILTGAFHPAASLPDVKVLQARYDASYRTVRTALESLEKQEVLAHRGTRFCVPAISAPAGAARILFLWYSDKYFLPSHETDCSLMLALERACFACGITLEKMVVTARGEKVFLRRHEQPEELDTAIVNHYAGIVYLVSWRGCVNQTVLAWFARMLKPLSIVDWLGDWKVPPSLAAKKDLQWLASSACDRPGFDAARYLIGLGHRTIACFAPFALDWAKARVQGAARACLLAGESHSVVPFMHEGLLPEEDMDRLVRERSRELYSIYDAPSTIQPDYLAGRTQLSAAAWIVHENAVYYDAARPLFEQALSNKEVTAWIGCNDTVALMAWSFLRSKGVAVPGDISLIGFGNTLEAVKRDITSYDLNFSAAAATAVNFLLRPEWSSRFRTIARPRIDGFVIERGSTAPARRR